MAICICILTSTVTFGMYSSDIGPNNANLYDINYVLDNGYMSHTSGQQFNPASIMKRSHIAILLYRFAGEPYVAITTAIFTDIPTSSQYYKATKWLKENGIMNGVTQTTFGVNQDITKQDFVVCLYRFASHFQCGTYYTGVDLSSYSDGNSVSNYAANAMKWGIYRKIVIPENNNLNPLSNINRVTCANMISTYSKKVEGVKAGRDNYSFSSSNDFGINSGDYSNLIYFVNTYYTGNDKNAVISQLNNLRYTCQSNSFGLAAAAYLDKVGKLNLKAYQNGAESVYDLDDTQDNATLRSVISFYELTQYIPNVMATSSGNNLYSGASDACNKTIEQGLCLVIFNFGSEKIPSILYDGLKETNGYSASFYTPDHPEWTHTELVTYKVSNQEKYVWIEYYDELGGFHYAYLDSIQKNSDSNQYFKYDADGLYNSTPYLPNGSQPFLEESLFVEITDDINN